MNPLRLTSSNSDIVLEFSDVQGDRFRVSVVARDHSATRLVYACMDPHGISRLLADAARAWRGWEGQRVWESIERDLRLELTHDGLGHVALRVRITADAGRPDRWEHQAELTLDAGRLEHLADEARRFWAAVPRLDRGGGVGW